MPRAWRQFLRFGFRLLYNEMAWSYDFVSWAVSLGQWRDWQRAALPFLTGRHVLELAHGPGHMLMELEKAGMMAVGFDLSPQMGRIASERLRQSGVTVPLVRGEAQAMPFASEAFDSVLATFPTEFIAAPDTLAHLYRMLRPGGRLVVVPEARLTGGGLLRRSIEWLYAITGQRLAPDESSSPSPFWMLAEQGFRDAGFVLQLETVILEGSQVLVVIAHKAGAAEDKNQPRIIERAT